MYSVIIVLMLLMFSHHHLNIRIDIMFDSLQKGGIKT